MSKLFLPLGNGGGRFVSIVLVWRVGVVLDEVAHPDACGRLCASQISSPLSIHLPVRAET